VASRYTGPVHASDQAESVAVSPGEREVFVTGNVQGRGTRAYDYATVAYNAATGRQLWARWYNAPGNRFSGAIAVAASPHGGAVYVTGSADGGFGTVAYNAATGRQLWASHYHGYEAQSVAVSPDGTTVYVTGGSATADYATIAYNAATGSQLRASLYHGPANNGGASTVAVNPTGTTVFVTGWTQATPTTYDYTTIAYRS
jgi:DNA-binding beta-propeller fold protein YncE